MLYSSMSGIIIPSGVISPDRNRGNHTNANPSIRILGPSPITDGVLSKVCTMTFVINSPVGNEALRPLVHLIT